MIGENAKRSFVATNVYLRTGEKPRARALDGDGAAAALRPRWPRLRVKVVDLRLGGLRLLRRRRRLLRRRRFPAAAAAAALLSDRARGHRDEKEERVDLRATHTLPPTSASTRRLYARPRYYVIELPQKCK